MRLYKYIETKAIHIQLRFLHNANYIKKNRRIVIATATKDVCDDTEPHNAQFFSSSFHRVRTISDECAVSEQGVKNIWNRFVFFWWIILHMCVRCWWFLGDTKEIYKYDDWMKNSTSLSTTIGLSKKHKNTKKKQFSEFAKYISAE